MKEFSVWARVSALVAAVTLAVAVVALAAYLIHTVIQTGLAAVLG